MSPFLITHYLFKKGGGVSYTAGDRLDAYVAKETIVQAKLIESNVLNKEFVDAVKLGAELKALSLLGLGADPNTFRVWYNKSVLSEVVGYHKQLDSGSKQLVEVLLSRQIDLESRPEATNIASCRDDVNLVQLFLNSGTGVNAKNSDGSTSLISAAACDATHATQFLLDRHADTSIRRKGTASRQGGTALDIAKRYKNMEIVKILRRYKAAHRTSQN